MGLKQQHLYIVFYFLLFTTKRFKIKSFKKNRKWKLPIFKDFIKFLDSIYEIASTEKEVEKLIEPEALTNNSPIYDFIIVGSGLEAQ